MNYNLSKTYFILGEGDLNKELFSEYIHYSITDFLHFRNITSFLSFSLSQKFIERLIFTSYQAFGA